MMLSFRAQRPKGSHQQRRPGFGMLLATTVVLLLVILSESVVQCATPKAIGGSSHGTSNCPNCVEESSAPPRWTMPLLKLGEKRYYLSIFFKANWFKALQYCRFHGMQLASIQSQEENDRLEKYVKDYGLATEHFWTSGTDLAEEGNFFWISNGRPLSFTNWNAGEPNNFRYENGEEEHCLELWNRDGKGLKWNDTPCSFETYFICEI
ncbi:C-type lectin 37Db-like isoform X1 [Anopheles albimanus]|uniref:C-type lectin 37Db-like isoform X1 n=1 Tax=Anopheles albimanus TaxID=7167 RepID=UPI00163F329D|nr:C-type lectin 37Db-like isoform X1 [Anopheles albimanus]